MLAAFWRRLIAPIEGMHTAAYVLGAITLLSQFLALFRDHLFAHVFGTGPILDLYYAAFKVPDLIFALVSSLVSAYILIPYITSASRKDTARLLSESFSFLIIGGGALCLVLGIFAPEILRNLYPHLMASPYHKAFVLLTRILLVQPILLGVSGVLGSVTQVEQQFFLFALAPALYNLGIIFGTLALYPLFGLSGIGYGVLLGALLYAATNIPPLMRSNLRLRLRIPERRVLLPIMKESIPRSLAMGMDSITLLFLTALAARLSSGSVAVFTLASNLENVPLALIGGSYAVAAFPSLSKHAFGDRTAFASALSSGARHILVWSLVAIGLIFALSVPLVRVILGTGAFTASAVRITAALLVLLVVGLAAQGLTLLFSRALYARRQSWLPLAYQIGSAVVTAIIALLLLSRTGRSVVLTGLAHFLYAGNIIGAPVLALAFAATAGEVALVLSLLSALHGAAPGLARSLARPLSQGVVAALLAALFGYRALVALGSTAPQMPLATAFVGGVLASAAALSAAAAALWVMRSEEFLEVLAALRSAAGQPQALLASATIKTE